MKFILRKILKYNRIYFDMRGLIEQQLRESFIDNVFHVNKDSYTEENLFFSHRRTTCIKEH